MLGLRALGGLVVVLTLGCGSTTKDSGTSSSDGGSQGGSSASGTASSSDASSNASTSSAASAVSGMGGTGTTAGSGATNTTSDNSANNTASDTSSSSTSNTASSDTTGTTTASVATGAGGSGGATTTTSDVTTGSGGSGGAPPACPDTPPDDGSDCTFSGQVCGYEDCEGAGRTLARCLGTWSVSAEACGDTVYCSGGAGIEECVAGQICMLSVGGALLQECVENTCGSGPVSCDCIQGCYGDCAVVGDAQTGLTITCNTCPDASCA